MVQEYSTTGGVSGTVTHARRRRAGPLPLRVYLVLKYLRAVASAGQPVSLSNASICAGVGYGSEGEVSQILRWLAGELPMAGRWAHRYLDTPQQLRYVRRERRPDGGYLTTVLAVPEPIVLTAAVPDDPVHDPANQAFPRAPQGIMDHDPSTLAPQSAVACPTEPAARDHARESESKPCSSAGARTHPR